MVTEDPPALGAEEARVEIAGGSTPRTRVLDIREFDEFAEAHIPGALHVDGPDALQSALEDGRADRWVIVCSDGSRSRRLAAELAQRQVAVAYLEGGMEAWASDDNAVQPPPSD